MALFSNSKGIKEAKETAGAMQYAGASSIEAVNAQKARVMAAELAKLGVFGALGSPGSYDAPLPGQWVPPGFDVFNTSTAEGSLAQPDQGLKQGKKGLLNTPREGILDPDKYTQNVMNSASFRTQSLRVAEAEQMLRGEGPEWDKLYNSTLGLISQQYAMAQRTMMKDLNVNAAKSTTGNAGGSGARNIALQQAREIGIKEDLLRGKADLMFEKTSELFWNVRANADAVAQGTTNFVNNLPLVNKQYMDAMQATADLAVTAAGQMAGIEMAGYRVKQSQQAVNFGENLLEGVIKMAVSPIMGGAGQTGEGGLNISGLASAANTTSEYIKGLGGQEPLQGPKTPGGMGPIDPQSGVWGSTLGWASGFGEEGGQTGVSKLFNKVFE